MTKKFGLFGVVALVAVVTAGTMVTNADRPRLQSSKDSPAVRLAIPRELPPVDRLPQQVSLDKAASVLQFDDGSCEAGLGFTGAATITAWVDFDVPTQCVMGGLQLVQATARVNTANTVSPFQAAKLGQAGPAPPAAGSGTNIGLSGPFAEGGACPGNAVSTRGVSGTVTGTDNFWLGIQGNFFFGRDTNSTPAGRLWLGGGPGGGTYSPAYLSSIGFGGNWMLRVTVEDTDCIPAELEGACCLSETECATLSAGECGAAGGLFKGAGVECTADPFELCESLYVTMEEMHAQGQRDGSVVISWTTAQEVDTAGFRVLREDFVGTGREKTRMWSIVSQIPAQGSTLEGASYSIVDQSLQAPTATTYAIVDIDLDGRATDHGAIKVVRPSREAGRRR